MDFSWFFEKNCRCVPTSVTLHTFLSRVGFDGNSCFSVPVGVGEGEGVGVGEGEGEGEVVGVGFLIATPLFQTSFFPDFTQVNFLPFNVAVLPAFLQGSPALTAATALSGDTNKTAEIKTINGRFIPIW
jgi:hypothetical protein